MNEDITEIKNKSVDDVNAVALSTTDVIKQNTLNKKRFLLLCMASLIVMFAIVTYNKIIKIRRKPSFTPQVVAPKPEILTDKITIEKGKVIGKILAAYNLSNTEISKIVKAAATKKVTLTLLNPGQAIEVTYTKDAANQIALKTIAIKLGLHSKLNITKEENTGAYKAELQAIQLQKEFIPMKGKIRNNIVVSAMHEGVPIQNLLEATKACSYEIDFQREIKDGDSFEILLEKFTSPEDGSTFFGKTLYFGLNMRGKLYKIYKFKPKDDEEAFFTSEYQSARRGLLKTPVQMARISSKFSMRKHPILGYSMMHKGVDFAAPHGAPIYAAASGTIVALGFKGGLGNHVEIRHSKELSTIYGHASRFAKNLKVGMRVKQNQVIAFVGMTGQATGPHLHYGLRYNGNYIDPLKFKTPSSKTLKGQEKEAFKNYKTYVDGLVRKA